LVLATACISFFYSAPPLRFKKYPYISNIAIAVSRGLLLIVAGWSLVGSVSTPTPWFVGLIFALYLLGAASTKDFADIKGDKKYGIMTLPVLYGAKKTAMIITPFFYLPFLLIPLGIAFNLIKTTAWPLTTLSLWGFYAAGLIMRNPSRLTLETNHISWIHMYLILITGQIGFALAYTII
jgi:4-hydroxybenzoate polyprenyltransferase